MVWLWEESRMERTRWPRCIGPCGSEEFGLYPEDMKGLYLE